MVVGLMSTYREGALALSAARSVLAGCDALVLYEGPVGTPAGGGRATPVAEISRAAAVAGVPCWEDAGDWGSDAAKRTDLFQFAKEIGATWTVWVDGDEVLIWAEYLRDWIGRAEYEQGAGGFPLRIVEFDGSVAKGHGRILRTALVDGFEESSYQVRLVSGLTISLPNIPICVSGGVPVGHTDGRPVTVDDLAELRPPLAGEPHILHRTILRSPDRKARRLHDDEPEWYASRFGTPWL